MPIEPAGPRGRLAPAVVLGVGLGAFVDGIVLHQVLGWHHILFAVHPPDALPAMHMNVVWDGLFQAMAWLATTAGVVLLWQAGLRGDAPSGRRFAGGLLCGFAGFNLVEGVLDHHLLKLHNVREVTEPAAWNVGFLVVSALLLVVGLALARHARVGESKGAIR